jgi:hypothetical protein
MAQGSGSSRSAAPTPRQRGPSASHGHAAVRSGAPPLRRPSDPPPERKRDPLRGRSNQAPLQGEGGTKPPQRPTVQPWGLRSPARGPQPHARRSGLALRVGRRGPELVLDPHPELPIRPAQAHPPAPGRRRHRPPQAVAPAGSPRSAGRTASSGRGSPHRQATQRWPPRCQERWPEARPRESEQLRAWSPVQQSPCLLGLGHSSRLASHLHCAILCTVVSSRLHG